MKFAEIILPLNLKGTFTYKIPEEKFQNVSVGMRVLVPFRGKKMYTGIIAEIHQRAPENFLPKEIISVLDEAPVLASVHLDFWKWISDYYLCNLGEIYRYSFPSSLKLESETYLKLKPNMQIDFQNLDINEMYLIQALEVRQLINISEIEAFIPKKDIIKTVNALIDLEYIEIDERIAEKYKSKEISYIRLKNYDEIQGSLAEILLQLKRSPKQQELYLLILEKTTENPQVLIRKSQILEEGNFAFSQLKSLIQKNLVEEYLVQKDRLTGFTGETEEIAALTDIQQAANDKISEAFSVSKNVLLHGVTASGKTHLYLEQIEKTNSEGKNVLVLLPEISLTKQITQRLEKKYGKKLGYYHQKLTDFERVEVWKKINSGELRIIIGTRNALFLPLHNVGLIVVDEEHDAAYRPKEVSPFFNAKDAAQILAKFWDAHVILGSATPSAESYYAAQSGKLQYVFLEERFGKVALPEFELINFKEAKDTKKIIGNFTNRMTQEIKDQLEDHQQVIILHNKRGYASVVECESCGYVMYCTNCDVVMTYHKSSQEMKCHYCGQKAAKPKICPKCLSENLNERGVGVEQIHEEISKIFPAAVVERMDVDAMRKKFAYEKLYEKIEEREADIIVGTQMISKGLDFDHIEMVGIPRVDHLLYVQDFRAEERAYQLITQVSGRAGRVSGKGKVLIQTYHPEHEIFKQIQEKNPEKIYEYILDERKKFNYPPFTKLILIELKHRKEEKVGRAAKFLDSVLKKYLPQEYIFGPEKSPIPRLNTLYQYQILLKLPRGKKYNVNKNLLVTSLAEFDEITSYKTIKKTILVDF